MKKTLLALLMMVGFGSMTFAQVIEDFESISMNVFSSGANGKMEVVPNPDRTGANTSYNVVRFVRGKDGDAWAGFYTTLAAPINLDANKYVHVKFWKPRISPVVFKVERADGNFEVKSTAQTLTNAWEEIVFDFNTVAAAGEYVKIVLFPDFPDQVGLTDDIVIYFDEIYINNDPAVGSAPVTMIEDYENIPMNLMTGGAEDLSSFTKVANPDPRGINLSNLVIKFNRDKDGVPWGGFWGNMPTPVDVTTNKYVHVKVWKPRISPVKFKLEGGAAGTLELASMNAQTKVNEWEDMVFDFSGKTGTYPIIAFMPDFADPVGLTEDIVIYFDDILVNNDPNPATPPEQIISVDMRPANVTATDKVYMSGSLGGGYGVWPEPGKNPALEMLDPEGDGIYKIWLHLPDGTIAFKFFKGAGWGTGDPAPGGDRTYTVAGSVALHYVWGTDGFTLGIPTIENTNALTMYPNPVGEKLIITSSVPIHQVIITSSVGQVVGYFDMNNALYRTIDTSTMSSGLYFVTTIDKNGQRQVQKLLKN